MGVLMVMILVMRVLILVMKVSILKIRVTNDESINPYIESGSTVENIKESRVSLKNNTQVL